MTRTTFKSYASIEGRLVDRANELISGFRKALRDPGPAVDITIQRLQAAERDTEELTGFRFEDKNILEIGPGQLFRQMIYFTCRNKVIGIDLDILVSSGLHLAAYWQMLRHNGPLRTAKTIGRKVVGFDIRHRREFARRLGVTRISPLKALQMDAANISFDEEAFDAVLSFSVFEHLPDPERVVDEVVRVLRPGGVAYLAVHLYTSHSGSHDPRIFAGMGKRFPPWPHLRPAHTHLVTANAFLNKLRLHEWEDLFGRKMTGAHFQHHKHGGEEERRILTELRNQGELLGFSDEELLTCDLIVIWKKPGRNLDAQYNQLP